MFEDVSASIHDGSGVRVSLYKERLVKDGITTTVTSTRYTLRPCPSDYFEGYTSQHQDQSYDFKVQNGFCLENHELLLSRGVDSSDFFRIKVENTTSDYS